MSRWILTLLLSLLLPAAWASTQRVALVVGNNAYAGLSPLVNAVADAELIASELQRAGFTVKLVRDANRRTLLREIREFSSRAEGGAEAVFYFAGHGIQVQSTNLLLPTDFQGRDDAEAHDEAVSLTWISNSLREAKARFSLLIIDACRNNPLPRSNGRTVGAERGLAPVSPAVGQMVIFSAGTGQEALDKLGRNDTNRNGLFVREFVRQMRRAGVPIDQMLRDVRDEVERQAASVKHAQRPALYDESKGQFYFFAAVPVAAATVAAAPATGAPVVPPATSIVAAGAPAAKTREQIEDELWASLSDSESVEVFEAYLAEYPNGRYAAPARIRIAQLRRSQAPRAAAPAVASAATAAAAAAPATTAAVRVPPAAAVAPAAPVAAAAPAAAVAPAPSVAPATPATPAAPATPVTAVAPVAKAAPSAPAPAAAGGPSPAPIALARPVVPTVAAATTAPPGTATPAASAVTTMAMPFDTGDRLVFRGFDPISGAPGAESTLQLTRADGSIVEFDAGAWVTDAQGNWKAGSAGGMKLIGVLRSSYPAGTRWRARLESSINPADFIDGTVQSVGTVDVKIGERTVRAVRLTLQGSTSVPTMPPASNFGPRPVTGQLLVEPASGVVLSISLDTPHPDLALRRQLVQRIRGDGTSERVELR